MFEPAALVSRVTRKGGKAASPKGRTCATNYLLVVATNPRHPASAGCRGYHLRYVYFRALSLGGKVGAIKDGDRVACQVRSR